MTTRLYKINGVYNTWQYWHDNYGYSESPSQPMSFKRSNSEHWGENAGDGYALNSDGELSQWSMWSEGIVGWFDANDLAEQGAYPASSADLFVERTGEKAKAVSLDDGTNTYYLIDGYLDLGWRLWEVLEAEGWQISSGGELSYIVVDEVTGEIVFSQNDPGMEFAEVGTLLMPDSEMIICLELGVPVEEFWLGENGRDSTDDVTLQANNKQYLRGEDGQLITDAGTIALYDQAPALAYIKADGNTYEAASGDYAFENERYPGSGEDLSLYTVGTGSTRSAWAALFEKKDIVLKVKWGDTVNVPSGLKVSEVRTFVGYAPVGYFGDFSGGGKVVSYGKINEYFDNIPNHNLIIGSTNGALDSAWPLLVASQGYQLNNTTGPHMQVYDFGAGYKNATSYWSLSGFMTNDKTDQTGAFSVYLRGPSTTNVNTAISSGYPVRLLWFILDEQGNAVWHKTPEAFRVPNSLWSFSHGTFSWLGNSEDITSLAWWYKHDWELFEWEEFDGAWIYIHCVRDENPEPPAPSELTAYFTSRGADNQDTDVGRNTYYPLYNAAGTPIDGDSSKTYTITGVYKADGTKLETSTSDFIEALASHLYWYSNVLPSTGDIYVAYKLTYTES